MQSASGRVKVRSASFLSGPITAVVLPVIWYKNAARQRMLFTESVDNFDPIWYFIHGLLIGVLAWGSGPEWQRLLAILLLPLAWGVASSRLAASLLVLGYYLCGARGLPGGSAVFFGEDAPVWFGWMLWLALCALLALPFAVLWSSQNKILGWRFPLSVCCALLPPLGLIGVLSPVAVAGVLFPGMGWLGVLLCLAVMGILTTRWWRGVVAIGLIALAANAWCVMAHSTDTLATPLANWKGLDTQFARLSSGGLDDAGQLLAAQQRVDAVRALARAMPGKSVLVLPETVLGPLDAITELALMDAEAALADKGSRLLVGSELASQGNEKAKNVVVVLGAQPNEARFVVQGIPAPVSMWKPWSNDGFAANVFGRDNTVRVNGVHVAVLICYEQVLAYSAMLAMSNSPDILVGVSNIWWARDTSIPEIQEQMMSAFSRLFGVGLILAKNR